jgi:hypothetical protein
MTVIWVPSIRSGQAGQFDRTQPGGQGLEPGAAQQDMQDGFVSPGGDLAACQGGAEPDLLAADLQVPGRRHHPAGFDSGPRRCCLSCRGGCGICFRGRAQPLLGRDPQFQLRHGRAEPGRRERHPEGLVRN